MKRSLRGVVALVAATLAMAGGNVLAQEKTQLSSDRDKVSYAVGMDVGRSLQPVSRFVDMVSFERALRNALAGGEPLQSVEQAQAADQALRLNLAAAQGGQVPGMPPGSQPPAVNREQVGLMLGDRNVGPALLPLKADLDIDVMLQAMRTAFAQQPPLLGEDEARQAMQAFMTRKQASAGAENRAAGEAFLSRNRSQAGVVTTPSGLQYTVLRQGNGPRPTASNRVRVNYEGKMLDGQIFDSSYERGQPAEFGLDQVIPGWTEGVALMAVGSKYRFWIPSALAYGPTGRPGGPIGPDATLSFDVELLGILP